MREVADAERIRRFMAVLGRTAGADGTCYLTGGATAVLVGWRATTLDIDVFLVPERDELFRELPRIKDEFRVNVELASPGHFIPLPRGWEERSPFVVREGLLTFRHFDPYSQALAKLERGHARDLDDVAAMEKAGLIEAERLRAAYGEIEPELYRFPAVDPPAFRARVEKFLG